jgi:hypothetical protein
MLAAVAAASRVTTMRSGRTISPSVPETTDNSIATPATRA